ncbi:MAG: hypothetical protein AB7O52_08145 [Planctomycetota bacterium]
MCDQAPRRVCKIVVVVTVAAVLLGVAHEPASACKSTRCMVLPGCAKSVVQGKAAPLVVVLPPGGGGFAVPLNLLVTCGNNCGGTCAPGVGVTGATTTVTICPGVPPCAPGCASPIAPVTVASALGTMPLPGCNSRGLFTPYAVAVAVPPGVFGLFCVTATTTVTFSDGMVLAATGDQVVCIVEELPGQPGVPRLNFTLDTTGFIGGFPRCAPGDQVNLRYTITNNDPVETFTVPTGSCTATSNQIARLPASIPAGMNETNGVFSISGPTADDFPIEFDPVGCILLPNPATFIQPPITRPGVIVVPPSSSVDVIVGIRSYPGCGCGSASETTIVIEGTFSTSQDPGLACLGTTLFVDTNVPFPGGLPPCLPCGFPHNDCNGNGVYDADDIFVNQTSSDLNFDAVPDECSSGGPANDECTGATPVVLGTNVVSNVGATSGLDPLPALPCAVLGAMDGDVWYTFTAAATVAHEFNTCNLAGGWDTDMALYEGACGALVQIACNGDGTGLVGCQQFYSRLSVNLTAGVTYLVRIGSWDPGDFNDGVLNISAAAVEDCANGLDDDLDGLVDCVDPDCSAIPACAAPANDDCAGATSVSLGATAFDTTLATDSGVPGPTVACNGVVGQFNQDVWFEFTPAMTGSYLIDTCDAASFDTDLLIYSGGCGGLVEEACSGDGAGLVGCQTFFSAIAFPLNAGTSYLIRIGGFSAATAGTGTLNIALDCGDLGAVTCSYSCVTDMVSIDWTDNVLATAGYDILENGVMVGSAPSGSSSFALAGPAVGANTYTIEWACSLGGMGATGTCTVTVQPPVVIPGTEDVILHLEGLQSAGALGLVDSGAALEAALVANGRTVTRVTPANFDGLINDGCLDLTGVQTLWVMAGTFPEDYGISAGEGDALAALAASGISIYFEGADHWGFQHVVSLLDDRDGIDAAGNVDGDDTYGQMDGANAAVAGLDLSANVGVAYTQDQAGNDFTDQLAITGTDASVTSVEAIWTNSDDTMTGEVAYVTGAIAVHADGGVMISTAWEFGGYGGNQDALALEYLNALGRTGPVGDMFKRGDCNNDGGFNIADAVNLLGNLFPPPGGMPNVLACRDACDGNNDGSINIGDAVAMIGALFPPPGMPSPGLPAPFGMCGLDTGMDALDCVNYNGTMAGCP